jgi:hypothetical protein
MQEPPAAALASVNRNEAGGIHKDARTHVNARALHLPLCQCLAGWRVDEHATRVRDQHAPIWQFLHIPDGASVLAWPVPDAPKSAHEHPGAVILADRRTEVSDIRGVAQVDDEHRPFTAGQGERIVEKVLSCVAAVSEGQLVYQRPDPAILRGTNNHHSSVAALSVHRNGRRISDEHEGSYPHYEFHEIASRLG